MTLPPITNYSFDRNFDNLTSSNLSLNNLTSVGAAPYTDIMGSVFWGFLFSMIFIMIWIRQEDITIPALLGLLIGGSMWTLMPADWVAFAMSLTIVSFAGLVYSLVKGRGY